MAFISIWLYQKWLKEHEGKEETRLHTDHANDEYYEKASCKDNVEVTIVAMVRGWLC